MGCNRRTYERWLRLDTKGPEIEAEFERNTQANEPKNISTIRNKNIKQTLEDVDPDIKDFYSTYDPLNVTESDRKRYEQYINQLSEEEKAFLKEGYYFYELTLKIALSYIKDEIPGAIDPIR